MPAHDLTRNAKRERIQRLWQKAARRMRQGNGPAAESAWRRLRGLAGDRGVPGFPVDPRIAVGPPVSPVLRQPQVARDVPRMVLSMNGTRHELSWTSASRAVELVKMDLVVDMVRKQVVHAGVVIDMHGREIPLRILGVLLRDRTSPMSDKDLFQAVWDRPLRSIYDIRTLYFHVHQIRKWLPEVAGGELILRTPDGYRMRSRVRGLVLEEAKMPEGLDRRACILHAARLIGHVDTRSVTELTGVSNTTSFRELRALVQQGLLRPIGSGRGARYLPAEAAA